MSKQSHTRGEDSYIFHDILPAFADYGYPRAGDTENLKIKGDVKIRMGSSLKEPDVVFYAEGVPVLLVESKKPGKSKQDAEDQARSYIKNFPIEKYSRDGRPPQYAAVTIGRIIYFYRYRAEINKHGAIIDRLEPLSQIATYDELKRLYGLKESEKPLINAEDFNSVFYQLVAALDYEDEKKISPPLILRVVELLMEFLKDPRHYTTRQPYTELDGHPDRQNWIRNLLNQYQWDTLSSDVATEFRGAIHRSFQGSKECNQYITPLPVIAFMTSLAGITAEERVLDFECGSGGFIAAAVQKDVPLQNVRGVDISALPAAVSKLYLALHFNVRGRAMDNLPVIHGNGLFEQGSDWSVVIGNPAGGNKYDPEGELGDIEEVYEVLERDLDQNERDDPASEYNFSIQRALRSAVVGGRICLVLPEGVFSNANTDYLRKYITKYCKIRAIVSLPRGIFYKGTTTRTVNTGQQVANMKMSILFVEKVAEVRDGTGTDISGIDTHYPVFLASVSSCPQNMDVNEYLNSVLELLLAEYKGWEESGELLQEQADLAYPVAAKKKRGRRKEKEAKLKRSITVAQSSIDEALKKPNTSEEAIISETFDDVF